MVSCITVTKNRVDFLKKSISHYINQTYNDKELIIGYYLSDLDTKDYLENLPFNFTNENNINFYPLTDQTTGSARNHIIQKASGEYLCIWDDDDYYHPNRIQEQLTYLKSSNRLATALVSILVYSTKREEVRLGFERITGWEGSLLLHKSIFTNYEDLTTGEDTPLLIHLDNQKQLALQFNPDLYIYILHDSNTSSVRHLENIFDYSFKLSPKKNREVISLIK